MKQTRGSHYNSTFWCDRHDPPSWSWWLWYLFDKSALKRMFRSLFLNDRHSGDLSVWSLSLLSKTSRHWLSHWQHLDTFNATLSHLQYIEWGACWSGLVSSRWFILVYLIWYICAHLSGCCQHVDWLFLYRVRNPISVRLRTNVFQVQFLILKQTRPSEKWNMMTFYWN